LEDPPLTSNTSIPQKNPFETLIELIEILRGDNGCPWDKKQTPKTIALYVIEEIYELFDAIATGNPDEICEELGDVLFQIFFIARLYQEKGLFSIKDVTRLNVEKMTRRHPHVFGKESVQSTETIKRAPDTSMLDTVPVRLPALMRAYRISERAARTGFDWPDLSGVLQKVEEEWSELKSALTTNDKDQTALEFGDVLFTLMNVARFIRVHPELALAASTQKFVRRFKRMEKVAAEKGRKFNSLTPEEMDVLWEAAKSSEGG
jgi:MazG family protein